MKNSGLLYLLLFYVTFTYAQDILLWKFSTGSAIHSSPTIDENYVYFGGGDMNLYSLNKNSGQLIWKFKTKGQVNSTPFVYENKIFINCTDGNIYSLDKNTGNLLWKFETTGEQNYDLWDYYLSSPIVNDGIVYVGSGDNTIYAIEAESGKNIWRYKTNGIVHASPIIKDKVLYIGSYDGFLYALDSKSGKLIWKFKTVGDKYFPKGEIQRAAAILNNTIIFGSRDGNIYALDLKTGTGEWNMKEIGSWIVATPYIHNDNIYFGTSDTHKFYCLSARTGEIKWVISLNMRVYGTASFIAGKLVFGCFNGKLYFVNLETGQIEFTFQTEESKSGYYSIYNNNDEFRNDFSLYDKNHFASEKQILALGSILSSPLVEDYKVFFGDANGYFYALSIK
jgi:outer membrane protein assembly factor BamB